MHAAFTPLYRHALKAAHLAPIGLIVVLLTVMLISVLLVSGAGHGSETALIAHGNGRSTTPFRWS
jgi:hypothetical protein